MGNIKLSAEKDYPLGEKRPDLIRTPTGKKLEDITLENVLKGEVKPEDVRISPETLELQAQIAIADERDAIAGNFMRASELIAVPDDRLLDIYNALRPFRSTEEELLAIADELEGKYNATVNAAFVREAAEVYKKRNRLKVED